MVRMGWNEKYLHIARSLAEQSTCARVKVGAVLCVDNRIRAVGINGSGEGEVHCDKVFHNHGMTEELFYKAHGEWSLHHEQHAEQNLIAYCAHELICTKDATLYLTLSPCISCAKLIKAAKIKEVYYIDEYDRDTSGIDFLKRFIKIEQIRV